MKGRTGPGFEDRYHLGMLKDSYKEMKAIREEKAREEER